MKKKNLILLIVIIAIGILIALRLISNKKELTAKSQQKVDDTTAIPVNVDTVKYGEQSNALIKTGNVSPYVESKILAVNAGRLASLNIKLGDNVKSGQVIGYLDSRILNLDLQKALSHEAKLQSDLQTYNELLAGNAATADKVKSVKLDYNDAVNQVNQARKNLSDAAIKAPTSGMISKKNAEAGMFLAPGTEIATVVDIARVKVQVYLTEAEVYRVHVGGKVNITTDVLPNKVFQGHVDFVSPQADETHSYLVEIVLEPMQGEMLRSGTFVYTNFQLPTLNKVMTIRRDALNGSVQEAKVFVVKGKSVELRPTKIAGDTGDRLIILNGLSEGDLVVTSGQINLKNGTKVRISN